MNKAWLEQLLASFATRRVAVFGDFFLDKYLDFDPDIAEVSVETGKTANQVVSVRHSPGAAGTVVCNLAALKAGEIIAIGFTGDDGEGYELRRDLNEIGCDTSKVALVPERRTPTYLKPRNVQLPGLEGESERYDTKNRVPVPSWVERDLTDSLKRVARDVDAVIVLDQADEENCGAVTEGIRHTLEACAEEAPDVVFWVDSRQRVGLFRSVITKPNDQEAVRAVFDEPVYLCDEAVNKAALTLSARSGKPVFVTRGSRGVLLASEGDILSIAGFPVDGPVDPTGAGDSFAAAAVLTLASGGTLREAAIVGNLAASLTVQQLGRTGTPNMDDMAEKWESRLREDADAS